jgi:hypothetical protein
VPIPANTTLEPAATSAYPRGSDGAIRDESDTEARTFLPISPDPVPDRFLGMVTGSGWSGRGPGRPPTERRSPAFSSSRHFPRPRYAACPCALEADANMTSAIAGDIEEFLGPARKAGLTIHVSVRRGDSVAQDRRSGARDRRRRHRDGTQGVRAWSGGGRLRPRRRAAEGVPARARRSAPRSYDRRGAKPVHARILCAVGLSERSPYTLSYALELARWTTSLVTVLHVADDLGGPRAGIIGKASTRAAARARCRPGARARKLFSPDAAPADPAPGRGGAGGLIVLGSGAAGSGRRRAASSGRRRRPSSIVPFPSEREAS